MGTKKFDSNNKKDQNNLNGRQIKKDAEEKTYYDEIYKRMKKYIGNVWISDLKYSDDIMINMIELAEKNNFIDGLPKVLINYYKRMKNKNYKK